MEHRRLKEAYILAGSFWIIYGAPCDITEGLRSIIKHWTFKTAMRVPGSQPQTQMNIFPENSKNVTIIQPVIDSHID